MFTLTQVRSSLRQPGRQDSGYPDGVIKNYAVQFVQIRVQTRSARCLWLVGLTGPVPVPGSRSPSCFLAVSVRKSSSPTELRTLWILLTAFVGWFSQVAVNTDASFRPSSARRATCSPPISTSRASHGAGRASCGQKGRRLAHSEIAEFPRDEDFQAQCEKMNFTCFSALNLKTRAIKVILKHLCFGFFSLVTSTCDRNACRLTQCSLFLLYVVICLHR